MFLMEKKDKQVFMDGQIVDLTNTFTHHVGVRLEECGDDLNKKLRLQALLCLLMQDVVFPAPVHTQVETIDDMQEHLTDRFLDCLEG